jgi:membrane protease YdiL (CAAX protease family)
MDSQLNGKRILIFLASAFGISWAAILAFYLTIGMDDPLKALGLANYVVLAAPALANVATRLITREGWGHLMLRPNFRRGWRYYLAAWLLPLAAMIVGGAVFYLLFLQSFDPNLGRMRSDPTLAAVWKMFADLPFAVVDHPWLVWLYFAAASMTINALIFAVTGIGEEFGWRAYLLPKLVERLTGTARASASAGEPVHASGLDAAGARKAALLVGVIWGVWHWPAFFIQMTFDPGMHILFPLVYLVSTCSLSVLMSWVALRSGSVWPAALVHGELRLYSALVAVYPLKGPAIPLVGPESAGLIGGIGFTILALVLFLSRRAFAAGKKARPVTVPAVAITHPG